MQAIKKVGPKGQVVIPQDAVTIFRKTAKGKLKLHPDEAYEEEIEERVH